MHCTQKYEYFYLRKYVYKIFQKYKGWPNCSKYVQNKIDNQNKIRIRKINEIFKKNSNILIILAILLTLILLNNGQTIKSNVWKCSFHPP